MKKISEESLNILHHNDEVIAKIRQENQNYFQENGKKKQYFIRTYGCQMNEHDSEKLSATIEEMGYVMTPFENQADLIIINTCCVRENAELKVYGKIGTYKTLKEKNPDLVVAICGCMMQQPHVVNEIKRKYRHVDVVFGTHNVHNFPNLLNQAFHEKDTVVQVWDIDGEVIENTSSNRKYDLKAFVNIMYGCNNFCTYCIVPYTRGRERSREKEDILAEIKDLIASGTKEITLLGQNVNSYGKTLDQPVKFSELLAEVAQLPGLKRLRFMTSHPKDIDFGVIDVMAKYDCICNYLHLPVQAGSDRLLKAMNRNYTVEQYLDVIDYAKMKLPGLSISTDLIIGFPGETEDDIEALINFLKLVEYDSAFTFIYSQRKGTPADEMENQIPEDIKHQRFNRVLEVLNEIIIAKNMALKGKTLEVLVDHYNEKDDNYVGRTEGNRTVHFKGSEDLIGTFVNVLITNPKKFSLQGEIVNV